jgi:flavin-binding protein dodecin
MRRDQLSHERRTRARPDSWSSAVDQEETRMSEHVYKILELTGSSPTSIEDAVANAIAKAAKTVRRMQWFQVLETRGHIEDGSVSHWQVTVKVGFTLD